MAATVAATSKGKSKADAQPVTFDEIARSKMRKVIEEYRTFVERSARDEGLTADELDRVLECLAYMSLPDYAWERDVKTHRDYLSNARHEADTRRQMPEADTRARQSTQRIKALEDELRVLKQQHYTDTQVLPRKLIGYGQRLNELSALNPHLFANVDEAVRLRMADKNKGRPMPADPLGWSTT
jgi:hypothetical protein